jgi:hypothetical protein
MTARQQRRRKRLARQISGELRRPGVSPQNREHPSDVARLERRERISVASCGRDDQIVIAAANRNRLHTCNLALATDL